MGQKKYLKTQCLNIFQIYWEIWISEVQKEVQNIPSTGNTNKSTSKAKMPKSEDK